MHICIYKIYILYIYINLYTSTYIVWEIDCKDSLRSPTLSGSCMFCKVISEHLPPSCT